MDLIALTSLAVAAGTGFGVRVLITKIMPGRIKKRLKKLRQTDPKASLTLANKWLMTRQTKVSNQLLKIGIAAAVLGVVPLLLVPIEQAVYPVLGYLLGITNWRGLLKSKGDLEYFFANEVHKYREVAAESLLEVGTKEALEVLSYTIRDLNHTERLPIFRQMIDSGSPKSIPYLIQAVNTAALPLIRVDAFHALKHLDLETFLEKLPQLTKNNRPEIRKLAVDHLDMLDPAIAQRLIQERKKDESSLVRSQAEAEWQIATAKAEIKWIQKLYKRPDALPYLNTLKEIQRELTGGSWQSIQATKEAMWEVGQWEDIESLLKIFKTHVGSPTLVPIVKHLSNRDDRESVEALLNLLSLPDNTPGDYVIQQEVIQALGKMESLTSRMIGSTLKSSSRKAQIAIIRVLANRDESVALGFIRNLAKDSRTHLRIASIQTLSQMAPNPMVKKLLTGLVKDVETKVRVEAYPALAQVGDIDTLLYLIGKYDRMGKNTKKFSTANMLHLERNRLEKAIQTLIAKQPIFNAPRQQVYCTEHRTRAKMLKQNAWEYPVCRRCQRVDTLISDVITLRGIIGVADPGLGEKGQYEVKVWDEVNKTPTYADIDVLEIRAGVDMDYDWAINAVLGELRNEVYMQGRKIPVEITGKPNLHPNSIRLLKELTGGQHPLYRP